MSIASDRLIRPTVDEAIRAVIAAAFEVTDEESSDFGRKIVHSYAGFTGADWDLDGVIVAIKDARDIAWMDHWDGHNLAVLTKHGRLRWFDVKRPEVAQAEQPDSAQEPPCTSCGGEVGIHPDGWRGHRNPVSGYWRAVDSICWLPGEAAQVDQSGGAA